MASLHPTEFNFQPTTTARPSRSWRISPQYAQLHFYPDLNSFHDVSKRNACTKSAQYLFRRSTRRDHVQVTHFDKPLSNFYPSTDTTVSIWNTTLLANLDNLQAHQQYPDALLPQGWWVIPPVSLAKHPTEGFRWDIE
ncbi:hypothetical protein VNI00_005787 [Paramarasmius palmivorus]|uniref:Uncharacterized protein n=1 Tax=Paramarasmius palmivorus TaxID=297713 RepID=A0AAW0DAZ0_9AGAR